MADGAVRVGLGLRAAETAARDAILAEEHGFDAVFCGEHVFFRAPVSNPFVVLAAAAAATRRVRLLTAVTLAPLYPPALLAKLASTLDQVSSGRLELGVGVGGEYPSEFAAVGVALAERGRRTDGALTVMQELFAGQPARDAGTGMPLPDTVLDPLPAQPGGPPIWIAGRSAAARARAARWGYGWLPYLVTAQQLAEGLEDVRRRASDLGRVDPVRGAVHAFVVVNRDGRRAEREAGAWLEKTYGAGAARAARSVVAGSPQACAERIEELRAAGAACVNLSLVAPADETPRVVELLGQEVLPMLR